MAANKPIYQTQADIEKIKLKMSNLAVRTTREALTVMRSEAVNVRDLAMKFAPRDKGLLDSPDSWDIVQARTGVNNRLEFTIKLNNRRWILRGKNRVTLSMYASLMHNGWGVHTPYNLGKNSVTKARSLGLSSVPTTMSGGYYVGWKFLTRAAKIRSLVARNRLAKAIGNIY